MISWTVIDELFLVNAPLTGCFFRVSPATKDERYSNDFPRPKAATSWTSSKKLFPSFRTCVATCPNFMIFHLQTKEMIKINEATLCLNEANQYLAPDGHQLLSAGRSVGRHVVSWQVKGPARRGRWSPPPEGSVSPSIGIAMKETHHLCVARTTVISDVTWPTEYCLPTAMDSTNIKGHLLKAPQSSSG